MKPILQIYMGDFFFARNVLFAIFMLPVFLPDTSHTHCTTRVTFYE